jgi:hypothetical protein
MKETAMTAQRARAYARVLKTIEDLAPAKLLPSEQATTRLAADALLFCTDIVGDDSAWGSCADLEALGRHLVASGRWTAERADELMADVLACGPELSSSLSIAA